jgi:hypothetical protein
VPSRYYVSTRTKRATRCRQCGKPRTDARPLSTRALCADCAEANMTDSARQLIAREGPAYEQWRRSLIEAARRLEAAS